MAECGVDGRCRTLCGGDDSTVFKHHNGPVGHRRWNVSVS